MIIKIDNKISEILNTIDTTKPVEYYDSIKRLQKFVWDRSLIKKVIMTKPYNAARGSLIKYLKEPLQFIKCVKISKEDSGMNWYAKDNNNLDNLVSSDHLALLAELIDNIIKLDFTKITKLSWYLKNIASICSTLNIPIWWSLPHGLKIHQSYLETTTQRIKIFSFSNSRININVPSQDGVISKNKQIIALMPNLIHSLDATSMTLLYDQFHKIYQPDTSLYSIHDCFATTSDKVESLMTILKSVYTKLYSSEPYLRKFDEGILNTISANYNHEVKIDSKNRKITYNSKTYKLHDLDWVFNKKVDDLRLNQEIDSQYLVN